MHLSILPPFTALISFTALTLAVPVNQDANTPSALLPRSDNCYNAPKTKAGTPLHTRSLPPLTAPLRLRTPPTITWCAPGTETALHITFEYSLHDEHVETLILDAATNVAAHISSSGDGLLANGAYTMQDYGFELSLQNADNHQLTWGVVKAALVALAEYMQMYLLAESGLFGAVTFAVLDGGRQVGTGAVQFA